MHCRHEARATTPEGFVLRGGAVAGFLGGETWENHQETRAKYGTTLKKHKDLLWQS